MLRLNPTCSMKPVMCSYRVRWRPRGSELHCFMRKRGEFRIRNVSDLIRMERMVHVVPPCSCQPFPLTRPLSGRLNIVVQKFLFVHLLSCVHCSDSTAATLFLHKQRSGKHIKNGLYVYILLRMFSGGKAGMYFRAGSPLRSRVKGRSNTYTYILIPPSVYTDTRLKSCQLYTEIT